MTFILQIAAGVALAPVLACLVLLVLRGIVGLYVWFVDELAGGLLVFALLLGGWLGIAAAMVKLGVVR